MKVTKSELIAPEMLLKSVQNSSKHVVVAASDNKRSENSNDTGSVDLLISELNSIALSPNFENASKEGDSAVNQSKGSLESYVDQEKKILEYVSVKDRSVSTKVSDGFSSTVESQVQAAFLTSKPVPVSIAIPTSSRSNDVISFLIQGTQPLPCTSSERLLLNCRQASQPMELWQLPLIPPG
ncbi:hypothetical protein RchiOBHm_Chr5g0080871 [Rosa chinensis]|uniref:Uncharacterized protein n=1 Tax=Rosa chinensis TaxID=74649 RepID=A0A2P6QMX5_ROSCH|nr:hypothetical protein RchiOBHm_Chr5g0080871 [Rosa chinensis]